MNYYLRLFCVVVGLVSCAKEEVGYPLTSCYPDKNIRRSYSVTDAPVRVSISGGLSTGFQLIAGNGVAWSACNLPDAFKRDSLTILVSGYFLTSPDLELKNLSPLPFEVTSAKVR